MEEGVPIPLKEDRKTASIGHFLSKSFLLSELTSLILKRLLPKASSKILLEPTSNLQISATLLEIQGLGRTHQENWVVMTFSSASNLFI